MFRLGNRAWPSLSLIKPVKKAREFSGYWLHLVRAQLSGPRLRARVGTRSSYNFYQRKQKFFLADREKLWFVIRGGKVSRMQYWWNDLRARNPFQQRLSLIVRMNGGRSEASQHSEKPDAKNFLKKRALGQNWALGQTESFCNRSKETHCLVDFFYPGSEDQQHLGGDKLWAVVTALRLDHWGCTFKSNQGGGHFCSALLSNFTTFYKRVSLIRSLNDLHQ